MRVVPSVQAQIRDRLSAATAGQSGYSSRACGLRNTWRGMLRSPDDIADLIVYTTSRARHVNLRQAIVLPTRQA